MDVILPLQKVAEQSPEQVKQPQIIILPAEPVQWERRTIES